jgi:hypothetical protein
VAVVDPRELLATSAYPAFDIAHVDTVANLDALWMILRVAAGWWVA